jgi:glutaminyl-tRNA synthetase
VPESNRRVKGTVHWVSATETIKARINVYDRLFKVPEPGKDGDLKAEVNENSLEIKEAFFRTVSCGFR